MCFLGKGEFISYKYFGLSYSKFQDLWSLVSVVIVGSEATRQRQDNAYCQIIRLNLYGWRGEYEKINKIISIF